MILVILFHIKLIVTCMGKAFPFVELTLPNTSFIQVPIMYTWCLFSTKNIGTMFGLSWNKQGTQRFTIYTCTSVPSGPIQIIASLYVHVDFHGNIVPQADGHTDPNIAHENFKRDCYYFELHGVTYEQYMVSIIDKMIDQLDCSILG